ncbi:MAG: leucine-rich repeat domain-containing protein [Bacteroidales bacterium]|nr:leucine-rich repeat domain-containing protein [Bacteroidales bacterium]
MKRLISSLCAVLLAISTIGQNTFTVGDLTYEITSANTVEVHDCATSATSVTIPESIVNPNNETIYSVTAIGSNAFWSCYNLSSIEIPNSITSIGASAFVSCTTMTNIIIPNSVTSIGNNAFQNCNKLSSITLSNTLTSIGSSTFRNCSSLSSFIIPNSVTSISSQAFLDCLSLTSVTLPESATIAINAFDNAGKRDTINGVVYAGNDTLNVSNYKFTNTGFITFYLANQSYHTTEASIEYCDREKSGAFIIPDSITSNNKTYPITVIKGKAFYNCEDLTSIIIPNTVKIIGTAGNTSGAFENCKNLKSITIGCNVEYIGKYAFRTCKKLETITCFAENAPLFGSDVFSNDANANKTINIPYNSDYSSWQSIPYLKKTNYLIQENDTITLESDFMITNKVGLINNGVLRIPYGKQLIDTTNGNITGIIEVETDILSNSRWSFVGAPFSNYKLDAIKEGTRDVAVSTFDYTTGNWSSDWATIETPIGLGEGFFLWSFANEKTVFTTNSQSDLQNYSLNNAQETTITKNLTTYQNGNWFALANPYTFKLDADKFIETNKTKIQGQDGIYKLNNNGEFQYITQGEINLTEGFFVNYVSSSEQTVTFAKNQRLTTVKAEKKKEYIKIKMQDGERESTLLFSLNPEAKQEYDIYDANKLFSITEVAEPYFLTDNIALVKEEVETLPYTATLNIKSYESKEITLRIDNIPEGIAVSLFDNGQNIPMNDKVEYTTNITEGENADRFQLLVRKSRDITQGNDYEITITNRNREIYIDSSLDDLQVKVFNSLGQEILYTKERIFTLNNLPAGAYLVKAFSKNAIESAKIILQ